MYGEYEQKANYMYRVLIIDDHRGMREVLADLLSLAGFEVVGAADGRAGLNAVRQTMPDLIICDLAMPEMDGFGVIDAIRAENETRDIPIIVLTATPGKGTKQKAMDAGATAVLYKPYDSDEVFEMAFDLIRARKRAREDQDPARI